MAEAMDRFAPAWRRIRASTDSEAAFTTSRTGSSSGSRSRISSTPSTKRQYESRDLGDGMSCPAHGSSVAGTVRSKVKDERVAQMLDHFTQYVGSSPYGSPAVLCAIAHMQAADGVWYPWGGTARSPKPWRSSPPSSASTIRTDRDVRVLRIENGAVTAS